MKNRTLLTLIAVALAMNSFAQTEKGRLTIEPHVGMTIANFVGSSSTGSTGQIGFTGGFDFQYGISERLSFSIGANYAQYGARDHGKHGMVGATTSYTVAISENNQLNYHVDYLTFPVTLAFHPYQGLFLSTGVQLGVKTRARAKGETQIASMIFPHPNVDPLGADMAGLTGAEMDQDIGDKVKTLDFGIPIGIGYEYKNVTLDVRYLFGLLNISKEDGEHMRNSAFMITLGYKLPFPKR